MRDDFTQDEVLHLLSFAFCYSDPEIARVGMAVLPDNDKAATEILCHVLATNKPEELIGPEWRAVRAVTFFEYIGHHGRAGLIVPLLQHQASGVRWAAIELLGKLDETSAVDAITAALSDSAEGVRAAAKRVLTKLHMVRQGTVDIYKKVQATVPTVPTLSTRERLILELITGRITEPVDPTTVLQLLAHPVSEIRKMAQTLARARLRDRDAVAAAIARTDVPATQELLELLGEIGDPRLGPYIAACLGRDEFTLQSAATHALARIGDEPSIERLVLYFSRTSWPEGARTVLLGLGELAAPSLLKAYVNEPRIRRNEAELVARLAGPEALNVLLEALEDRYLAVRENAEKGLETLGQRAVNALIDRLASENQTIRHHATGVLGRIGDPSVLAPILRMASEGNAHDRWMAIEVVSAFPADDRSLDLLCEGLHSSNRQTRTHAVKSLGAFQCFGQVTNVSRILSLLGASLKDKESSVRMQGIHSLCALGIRLNDSALRQQIIEMLLQSLKSDENELKQEAISALIQLGRLALESLNKARETADEDIASLIDEIISRAREQEPSLLHVVVRPEVNVSHGHAGLAELGWGDPPPSPASIPGPITDDVQFSITAPRMLFPGEALVLDIWAHLECSRETLMQRAREAYGERILRIRSRGPVQVERNTTMHLRLQIPAWGLEIEDMIHWRGITGNCPFPVTVPVEAKKGNYLGWVRVYVRGLQISTLHFELEVGTEDQDADDMVTRVHKIKSAFASYASENRDEVLARIQGMLKILPDLDVFLDIVSLRSGEMWESRLRAEIVARDVFYLFWSLAASQSTWVQKEWRTALAVKGLEFINPVPLESPGKVPPPAELASLHFNEWTLAYRADKPLE